MSEVPHIALDQSFLQLFSICTKFRGLLWQSLDICRLCGSRISKHILRNGFQLSMRKNFMLIRAVQGRNGLPYKLKSFVISCVVQYWRFPTGDDFESSVYVVNGCSFHIPYQRYVKKKKKTCVFLFKETLEKKVFTDRTLVFSSERPVGETPLFDVRSESWQGWGVLW